MNQFSLKYTSLRGKKVPGDYVLYFIPSCLLMQVVGIFRKKRKKKLDSACAGAGKRLNLLERTLAFAGIGTGKGCQLSWMAVARHQLKKPALSRISSRRSRLPMMDFSAKQWLSQPEVVCQGRSVVVCQVTKRNQLLAGDWDDLVKHYPRHNFITG